MPIPASERKAWAVVFAEQFASTPAPYFGTNIFDVLAVNWEPLLHNVRQQYEGVKQLGGRSHQFGRELPMVLYDGATFRRALRSRADAVGQQLDSLTSH